MVSVAQGQHSAARNQPQQNGIYHPSVQINPGPPWGLAAGFEDSANQTTRELILAYIVANPGVYLREVADDLDFSMGVVQYHIWALTKDGEVEDCRAGRFRRFFDAGTFQELERKVISLLRQETAGRILTLLSKDGHLTHTNLARVLGISSQALSWQIARLRTMGVVQASGFQGRVGRAYALPESVSQVVAQRLHETWDVTSGAQSGAT